MKETLRQYARSLGFSACGFTTASAPTSAPAFFRWLAAGYQGEMRYLERTADQRSDPRKYLAGARSVLCLAVAYAGTEASATACSFPGWVARYAGHADYHEVLAPPLRQLMEKLREYGGPETRSLAGVDASPILERDLAQRAGVGFLGKHTNLISRTAGNWILLAEIITTLELPPDPPEKNHCGSCHRCLDACPTGAIVAPFQLDARRCLSYLTIELRGAIPLEFRAALGNRIFGCDDCLAACPWNRFAQEGRLMREVARPDLRTPDLVELLQMDAATFRRRFVGTPLMRAKWRGLRRNGCVALGNVGDLAVLPVLEKLATDPDPLVAEHAAWAAARIRARFALQFSAGNAEIHP